jgi:hypothetical protein
MVWAWPTPISAKPSTALATWLTRSRTSRLRWRRSMRSAIGSAPRTLQGLAAVETPTGRPESAVRRLGRASAVILRAGWAGDGPDLVHEATAASREALGNERFDELFRKGSTPMHSLRGRKSAGTRLPCPGTGLSFALSERCGHRFMRDQVPNQTFGLEAEALPEHEPV